MGNALIHPSEDEIENYLLGRFAGDPAALEDHLLICGVCLDWAQVQGQIIGALRECLPWPVPKREHKTKPKVMTASQGWLF
jgi:hypothetical protein